MSFVDFLGLCRKRWVYIAVPVLLALIASLWVSQSAPRIYKAQSSTYFSMPGAQSANDLFQGSNYTQQQLASFAALATKPVVLARVIADLGLVTTPKALARNIEAEPANETVIIEITASSESPQEAAAISNAVSRQLAETVRQVSPENVAGKPAISAMTVAAATAPTVPSSPNTKVNLAAALLAGLFGGVLLALVRERLDTKVRSQADLPDDVAMLSSIEYDKSAKRHPVVTDRQFGRAENFRRLRTNLRFTSVDLPARVLVITSSIASEGKTSTAINLALVCARAGDRVMLVDADLRRPSVAEYLEIEGSVGLVDVLTGDADLDDICQQWATTTLTILPSGSIPPNPSEMLGSQSMADLLAKMRSDYDLVVLDAPPLLPVTDAAVLAGRADGVVVVSGFGRVKRHQVKEAIESLRAVKATVFGIVLNMVPVKSQPYRYDPKPTKSRNRVSSVIARVRRIPVVGRLAPDPSAQSESR